MFKVNFDAQTPIFFVCSCRIKAVAQVGGWASKRKEFADKKNEEKEWERVQM